MPSDPTAPEAQLAATLAATLAAVPDLLFEFDHHGQCLAATAAPGTAPGTDPAQWVGRDLRTFMPPEAAGSLRSAIARARRRGRDSGRVFPWPQGTEARWFEVSAARKPAFGGGHSTVIVIARDITERHLAMLAAQQTNRALRLLNNCAMAFLRAEDESWLLEEVCRLICETGGYLMAWVGFAETDPGLSVRPVAQWGFDHDYLRDVQISWSDATPLGQGPTGTAIRTGRTQVNQDFRNNPAMRPWQEAARARGFQSNIGLPLRSGEQTFGALTIYATEPFAFSPEEVVLLEELAASLAFGIETLRERQRRVAAETAAAARSAFLASLSHEIRTPMSAILGMTHLTLGTELTTLQRGYLHKIQAASRHLLGILDDILDYAKIEADRLPIERIDFELAGLLERGVALIGEQAAAAGIELTVEVAPLIPARLVGDPLRLGQVLVNFASNAVKFTERGEIAIEVRVAEADAGQVTLRFAVRDTGIGIGEEERTRLFQGFQQADTSIPRRFGGSGLGLAIAKRLAELMGGTVGFASSPGAGSTFWFTARLGRAATQPQSPTIAPDLSGRRALVVDDHDGARRIAIDLLRGLGLRATGAADGPAALSTLAQAAAESDAFALVLLDWQMPGMDGIATALAIRRLDLNPPARLLLTTARAGEELIAAAQDAGLADILIKPLMAGALADTLAAPPGRGDGPTSGPAPATASPPLPATGARILLVEDNLLNQEVAAELLRHGGFTVEIAADGAAAVQRVLAEHFDLVLMDVQMPIMDGLAATRAIRAIPDRADLPILAMTANALPGDRERCLAAGMNDHLPKPIDPETLWNTVRRWARPPTAAPAARPPAPARGIGAGGPTAPPVGFATEIPAGIPQGIPTGISGLDSTAGLQRCLGREDLYRSLLGKFVTDARRFPDRLAGALKAADRTTAIRLAHTLKGDAAQLGAGRLRGLALQLEQALREGQGVGDLRPLTERLTQTLADLTDAISLSFPAAPAAGVPTTPAVQVPAPATARDPQRLAAACTRLAESLAACDFDSAERLAADTEVFSAAFGDAVSELAEAIAAFDFGTALERLSALAARAGITLTPSGR